MTEQKYNRMKCTAEGFADIVIFNNYIFDNDIKVIIIKQFIKSKNYDLPDKEALMEDRVTWEFTTDKTLKEMRRIMKEYYKSDGTFTKRLMHQTLNYIDDYTSGDESM